MASLSGIQPPKDVYGRRVIMHYEIGSRFLENISRMKNGCFVRGLSISKGVTVFPFNPVLKLIGRS